MSESAPERIGPYEVIGKGPSYAAGEIYRVKQVSPTYRVFLMLVAASPELDALVETLGAFDHARLPRVFVRATGDSGRAMFGYEEVSGSLLLETSAPIDAKLGHFIALADAFVAIHATGLRHGDLHREDLRFSNQSFGRSVKILGLGRVLGGDASSDLAALAQLLCDGVHPDTAIDDEEREVVGKWLIPVLQRWVDGSPEAEKSMKSLRTDLKRARKRIRWELTGKQEVICGLLKLGCLVFVTGIGAILSFLWRVFSEL